MKKLFALLLALVMVFGLGVTAYAEDNTAAMDELIAAAKEEGSLVVYGSCEEEYLAAACQNFQKLYGIRRTISACPPVRSPRRSRKRTASPPPTSGSAAPTTPMTTLPRRGCWSSTTR